MIGIFISTALIIAISMAFLCVKVLLRRNGRFSSQHIHDNKGMKERGIHCVIDQDKEERRSNPHAVSEHREI
jgi:hypothetical protein